MIQFKNWKMYSQVVNGVRFPMNQKNPFALIYFSENSSFLEDYPKLNILKIDARVVFVPITKLPRTRLTPDMKLAYKEFGLYAFNSNIKLPPGRNIILDFSHFLKAIDEKYKLNTYRQRGNIFINTLMAQIDAIFPNNYQRVLMYSVDTTKPFNNFINRKAFVHLTNIKNNQFNFSNMIFTKINSEEASHRLLMRNGIYKFPKIIQFMRALKSGEDDVEETNELDVEKASDIVVQKIKNTVDGNNISKYASALSVLFKHDKNLLDKVLSGKTNDADLAVIASTSIIYQNTNDLIKTRQIASKIPKGKETLALKAVDKQYADQLLQPEKTIDSAQQIFSNLVDIPNIVDNKSPEHIFHKRQIDFEINLKKDLTNSFNVLSTKDVPLKLEKLYIEDKPSKPSEISKSDISYVFVELRDKFGKLHKVKIEIPKITKDGTFRVNGRKKCLINQLVQCPITFPKPYDSKFESSYSAFHIWSKQIKIPYLEIYMGSYKGPFLPILAFSFGFEKVMNKYKIDYDITTEKPKKDTLHIKLNESDYLIFKNVDNVEKEQLIRSLIIFKLGAMKINGDITTEDFWRKAINKYTGRINSSYLINNNLENIVDPVAKQVLINMQLPYTLEDIMHYMTTRVVYGYTIERNDIGNQRIRNSEILVHLIQKQLLAAYTEYKEQVLSGNQKAHFDMAQTKVTSEFMRSEIVTDMEYANPAEEMSTMTRVSPVGSTVGGIPDRRAVSGDALNVHSSYFGNIDPLDTPEGGNIGIIQQLTIDAYISSARGMFNIKPINNNEMSGALSTSSALVPFVENNDGARVMFSCAQGKQAIPLKHPEPPIVRSGYESLLTNVLSDSFVKRSPVDGKIEKITNEVLVVRSKTNKLHEIPMSPEHLKSGSGKNTLSVFVPTVKVGQTVKERQIVAEGSCINQGMISMGRTLLAAFMPYKGYNFEDGIVISERLANETGLTSIHGVEEEIEISEKDRVISFLSEGTKTVKGQPLFIKTIGEIEELIGIEDIEDEESKEIVGGQFILKSPGGVVVEIEVFSNLPESSFPKLKDLSMKTKKKYGVTGNNKWSIKGENIKGILVKFKINQELTVGTGDKLTNRYGGKGVVALVEKVENMPRTPDGTPVDIIINPIGIIGRMNMGQVYELYTGLISKEMGTLILKNRNNRSFIVNILKKTIALLDKTNSKSYSQKLISTIEKMPDAMFKRFVEEIENNKGFFPIIIPPFKAPTYHDIIKVLKNLNLEAGYNLYLPEYKTNTISKVPVGYMYYYKLEHIGDMKMGARSTGTTTGKTNQPTQGKSRGGGQRLGEGDTLTFISYNATALLQEFFGPLSDDAKTKSEILSDIVQTGSANYREPVVFPARDLLTSYFVSLMLEG